MNQRVRHAESSCPWQSMFCQGSTKFDLIVKQESDTHCVSVLGICFAAFSCSFVFALQRAKLCTRQGLDRSKFRRQARGLAIRCFAPFRQGQSGAAEGRIEPIRDIWVLHTFDPFGHTFDPYICYIHLTHTFVTYI